MRGGKEESIEKGWEREWEKERGGSGWKEGVKRSSCE